MTPLFPAPGSSLTVCGSLSLHPAPVGAAMHLAGYRALGLSFTYVPFRVARVADLEGAVRGIRALNVRGAGISMPFKQAILPLLDELDPVAARIGAVNTVVNDEGTLTGHNTDAIGSARALEEVMTIRGARVLVIGAGGAARAIAFALADRGAALTLANRDEDKARSLADETSATAAGLDAISRGPWDAIVNATSVGMGDGRTSIVPEEAIAAGQVIMDIVYKPLETELVRAATRRGARAIHGGRMLLHQAAGQFELYTGQPAPLAAMDAALADHVIKPPGSHDGRDKPSS